MTQDELFDMAREAGFMQHLGVIAIPNVLCLERFAQLVAAAERDRMCEQFNIPKELAHEKAKGNEAD